MCKTNLRLVTVVNTIGPTSMAFNEIAMFRHKNGLDCDGVVVALESTTEVSQPEGLEIHSARGSVLTFLRILIQQISQGGSQSVLHFHHPRTAVVGLLLARLFRARYAVGTVFTVHSSFHRYSFLTKILSLVSMLLADEVTFVSHSAAATCPKIVRRCRPMRLHTIPNGVDVDRVDRVLSSMVMTAGEPEHLVAEERLRLVSVARLIPLKNTKFLLSVLDQLPGLELVLIGDGPERQELENYVALKGLDSRVFFKGLLPRESVFQELAEADVFVSASRHEGLPVAVLEAMAVGLPVVLSDIPPHREVANSAESAVVLPLDHRRWARTLGRLRELSRAELHDRGKHNRSRVIQKFSLDAMHESYTCVYLNSLGR